MQLRQRSGLLKAACIIALVCLSAGQDLGTADGQPNSVPAAAASSPFIATAAPINAANAPANAPANNATGASSPAPETEGSTNTSSPAAVPSPVTVDTALPFFKGIRSCLPFNILVAAPQRPAEDGSNSSTTTNGQITIQADPSVINATSVAVEDDILALSLVGDGFVSNQPILFVITAPLSGGDFESVSNYGSGVVVLGPGLNTSSLRISAERVGQVYAINVTANTLTFSGAGVLKSALTGAFSEVFINTRAAMGVVALTSVTPVNVSLNLGGITTLLIDAPEGSTYTGQAAGLSKVQYSSGECTVTSQSASLLPDLPGLGARGSIFGPKCINATSDAILSLIGPGREDPQWTCGVVVDGELSCAGANVTNRQEVALTPSNATTSSETTGANAVNAGTNAAGGDAGGNAAADGANFTTPVNETSAGGNAANAGGNAAGSNAGGTNAGGSNTGVTASSPAPNTAGTTPGTNVISGGGNAGGNAGLTGTATGTGARRLLKDPVTGRLLRQFQFPVFPDFPSFPTIPTVTTTTPTGTLTTGTFTSGPGASASSSSSTSGSGGNTFQTSTSQGGSTPVTVTGGSGVSNPVVVPAGGVAESPSPSPLPSPSPAPTSQPSQVSIRTGEGSSGIAVVNIQCAVNGSLGMLQAGEGAWVQPGGAAGGSEVNGTGATGNNAPAGGNAPGVNTPAEGNTTAGNAPTGGNTTGANAPAGNTAAGSPAPNGVANSIGA